MRMDTRKCMHPKATNARPMNLTSSTRVTQFVKALISFSKTSEIKQDEPQQQAFHDSCNAACHLRAALTTLEIPQQFWFDSHRHPRERRFLLLKIGFCILDNIRG